MAYYGWGRDVVEGAAIYENYLNKMSRFVLWLLDQEHHVRILTGEDTDERAVNDLLRILAQTRPGYAREGIVAEPVQTLQGLMRQIGQTQIVVATRFHNIVCALKLGRPSVSIGYAEKNKVLMADMGLGEFCQHVESLDVDLLIEQFSRLASDRSAYERQIAAVSAGYRERLAVQERMLSEKLLQ